MTNDSAFTSASYGCMGDTDRKEFHFDEDLSDDELIELLERNPRMNMHCAWISGEVLKNGWEWDEEEEIKYTDPKTKEEVTVSKDDYLELIKAHAKLLRGLTFARLHGTSVAIGLNQDADLSKEAPESKYTDFEVYHRTGGMRSGWRILAEDVDGNGMPFQISLYIRPAHEDGMTTKENKSAPIKVNVKRCVFIKNPKMGERWGGTPSSKLIGHVALMEELLLKLIGKHALNVVDAFFHVKNCKSQAKADAIHEQLSKKTLDELYTNGVELEPMRCEVQGNATDFDVLVEIYKDYMACGMRVSRQAMDGAPEGTLSSAEYNTIISYSVIEQIQNHFKPYIEDIFKLLGFQNPNFDWVKPMITDEQGGQDDKGQGQDGIRHQA